MNINKGVIATTAIIAPMVTSCELKPGTEHIATCGLDRHLAGEVLAISPAVDEDGFYHVEFLDYAYPEDSAITLYVPKNVIPKKMLADPITQDTPVYITARLSDYSLAEKDKDQKKLTNDIEVDQIKVLRSKAEAAENSDKYHKLAVEEEEAKRPLNYVTERSLLEKSKNENDALKAENKRLKQEIATLKKQLNIQQDSTKTKSGIDTVNVLPDSTNKHRKLLNSTTAADSARRL